METTLSTLQKASSLAPVNTQKYTAMTSMAMEVSLKVTADSLFAEAQWRRKRVHQLFVVKSPLEGTGVCEKDARRRSNH